MVPINAITNGNKPKENVTIIYSGNLNKIENPIINPDFGKVINRGSDTNFNITINAPMNAIICNTDAKVLTATAA